jgi:hypothetical protein
VGFKLMERKGFLLSSQAVLYTTSGSQKLFEDALDCQRHYY